MALYLSGMASTSCSTSDWERNRGGLSGSEGSGTLIAGLIASRLSAIAASRHWRSAKTALRMVEAFLSLVTNQSLGPSILVVAVRQLMGDEVEPWRKFIATNVPRWANVVDGTVCGQAQRFADLNAKVCRLVL